MDLQLKGLRAVVTGASSGIGRACVASLAREGCDVVVGYYSGGDEATATVKSATDRGVRAMANRVDVRSESSIASFVGSSAEFLGGIDLLVNAAGQARFAPTSSLGLSEWDEVLETNLRGPYLVCREALRHLGASEFGSVVNISSMASRLGSFEGAAYSASKAGLEAFSRSLALELGHSGIRVNVVAPGRTNTRMRRTSRGEYFQFMLDQTPLHRLAEPEEIADVVTFVLSPVCGFLTGETIFVDGGLHAVYLKHVEPDAPNVT